MKIRILDSAQQDLRNGYRLYEAQEPGLGSYFLDTLFSDIDSLRIYAGIHLVLNGGHKRLLSKRFPFAIYYRTDIDVVNVYAILDCRRNPTWNRKRLLSSSI